jgi:hypothetical protein
MQFVSVIWQIILANKAEESAAPLSLNMSCGIVVGRAALAAAFMCMCGVGGHVHPNVMGNSKQFE